MATEETHMLWSTTIVLLILCLIGLSIQLGWVLIHLLLVVAFGGAGHLPAQLASNDDLEWHVEKAIGRRAVRA
jgi:hypothetical protein